MKKSLSTLFVLMLGFPLAAFAQGTLKIGTVDMQRAFKEYNKTKEAEAKINDVVMEKVKANNLDLVFDKSGMSINGVPVLMYSHDNIDFTNDIIAVLNKPGRAAPPAVRTSASASATPARASKP